MGGQLKREWRVSAFVFSEPHAVDPDRGRGHDALKVDKDALAPGFRRKLEAAAVKRHKLVSLFIKAMPRKPHIRVRDHDSLKFGVIEISCMAIFDYASTVPPLSIHGEDEPAGGG